MAKLSRSASDPLFKRVIRMGGGISLRKVSRPSPIKKRRSALTPKSK
jgi:hypothetical protein